MQFNKNAILSEIENTLMFDITEANNTGISDISIHLENQGLISFTVEYRENQSGECWLQAEMWSDKINKAIIVDYDFAESFEDINDFLNALEATQDAVNHIESVLK